MAISLFPCMCSPAVSLTYGPAEGEPAVSLHGGARDSGADSTTYINARGPAIVHKGRRNRSCAAPRTHAPPPLGCRTRPPCRFRPAGAGPHAELQASACLPARCKRAHPHRHVPDGPAGPRGAACARRAAPNAVACRPLATTPANAVAVADSGQCGSCCRLRTLSMQRKRWAEDPRLLTRCRGSRRRLVDMLKSSS
jgi:hypothetical protein